MFEKFIGKYITSKITQFIVFAILFATGATIFFTFHLITLGVFFCIFGALATIGAIITYLGENGAFDS